MINVLSKETIERIAAGEVAERPSSVMKELVDNALDSGADSISAEIRGGGLSLIRVTDNGSGIEKDDIRNAFRRHATSKIRVADDIAHVLTMGFRGEALSSIAAVSDTELITRTESELSGTICHMRGGVELSLKEAGTPQGTTVAVRDFLYNVPVRREFLKSAQIENSYVVSAVQRLALANPGVSISLTVEGRGVFNTPGNGELRDVIYIIYGADTARSLVRIDHEEHGIHVYGYAGRPVLNKSRRDHELFIINRRPADSDILRKALEDAYVPYLMQRRFPFAVLNVELDPVLSDVNVHPQKKEIRFTDGPAIYDVMYDAVSGALKSQELIEETAAAGRGRRRSGVRRAAGDRSVGGDGSAVGSRSADVDGNADGGRSANGDGSAAGSRSANGDGSADGGRNIYGQEGQDDGAARRTWGSGHDGGSQACGSGSDGVLNKNTAGAGGAGQVEIAGSRDEGLTGSAWPGIDDDAWNEGCESRKGCTDGFSGNCDGAGDVGGATDSGNCVSDPVGNVGVTGKNGVNGPAGSGAGTGAVNSRADGLPVNFRAEPYEKTRRYDYAGSVEELLAADRKSGSQGVRERGSDSSFINKKNIPSFRIVGQVFRTYWIIEFNDEMYLIDQHAAHEKVNYEAFVRQIRQHDVSSQMLFPPIVLTLSAREAVLMDHNLEAFTELGYEIDHAGDCDYIVRAVPANLPELGDTELLKDLIGSIFEDGRGIRSDLLKDRIAMMSCKAAVKGNREMSEAEMRELAQRLLELDNPYFCPHGRPTIVKWSKYELDRMFKRIV